MSDYTPGPLPEPFFTLPTKAMTAQGVHVWASDGMYTYAAAEVARAVAAERERCAQMLDAAHEQRKHLDNHAAFYARMIREARLIEGPNARLSGLP
jgi:hypothetical protein